MQQYFSYLAEIDVAAVCILKNKVVAVFLSVVATGVESKSVFSFNAQNIVKLEELALPLMSSRLADTDKAAAVINKFLDCGDDFLVYPIFSSALRCICIADIDDNVEIIKQIFVFLISSKLMNETSNGAPLNASITPKYE